MIQKFKNYSILTIILIVFLSLFLYLFNHKFMENDTSFSFQIVVATMTAGLLLCLTSFINIFQEQIESRKENRIKVFERKIHFYNEAIDKLDYVFFNGISEDTHHQLLFLVSKGMLIASPEAADTLAKLVLSMQDSEDKKNIHVHFKDFIITSRKDLDLVDNISDATEDNFDPILSRLEQSIKTESRKLRYWSDEQKINIIKDYDNQKKDKVKWLKKTHSLYPVQISNWRKQI